MDNNQLKKMGFASKAIHGGYHKNEHGALATPIYQPSTFIFDSCEQGGRRFALEEGGYIYSRLGNPTNTQLEEKMALLEEGEACISTSSGMGAITSCFWSIVQAGDHIIAAEAIYGCTFAFLSSGLTRFGIEVTFVDTTDPQNVLNAMRDNTKVVYLETPANPTLSIADIEAISKIAHQKVDCVVIVDNTFATPYLQRPLTLGADIVVHSATKYLNGHGDVIAGFVVGKQEFINHVRLFGVKDMTGACLGPFDAFLIMRGLKTLDIRMERHCQNAIKVAEYLNTHPKVSRVYFPGLKDFPQKDLVDKQMLLPGAMICFEIIGGMNEGKKMMNLMKLASVAVSLGDTETLIEHPASMTHSCYAPEVRLACGISDAMVRLSVGLESVEDIIADLDQALTGAHE